MLPWTDRKGRFSPLKSFVLAGMLLPGLWIAFKLATGQMGPKPVDAAMHETGTWAVRLLLVTLAVTPFRLISGNARLILARRLLGLGALSYTLIHFLLYIIQQKYDLWVVASEIVLRFYLTIGFVAMAAMIALGATSTDGMIRRLGAARWNRLHALIYPLTVLAIIHAYLQAKINVSEEVVMTGIFLALMAVRGLRTRARLQPLALVGLALASGLAGIAIEALWYGLATGVPWRRILEANLNPDVQPRPGLVILLITALLPILALAASSASGSAAPRGRAGMSRKS